MTRAIHIIFLALLVFTPLALGGVPLWAVTVAELATLLMFCLFLTTRNDFPPAHVRWTAEALPVALLVFLAALSCSYSVYPYASIRAVYRLAMYAALFFVFVNVFDHKDATARVVMTIVGMGALLSFIGIILYLGHRYYGFWLPGQTLSATYVNRDHFAGYLEMAIPLAAGILFAVTSRTQKALLTFLIVLMLVAFILAASRGAWVSLVAASLLVMPFIVRKKLFQYVVLGLLICAAMLYAVLSQFDLSIAAARAYTIVEGVGVDPIRIITWMGTAGLVKAHPIVGLGAGTFLYAFPQFRPIGIPQHFLMDFAHNDYLQMAAELGLIGLGLMLWIIITAVWTGLHEFYRTSSAFKRGIALGATVGVLSMAFHSFVDFNLHIPANAILFTTLIGIIMAMHRRRYD